MAQYSTQSLYNSDHIILHNITEFVLKLSIDVNKLHYEEVWILLIFFVSQLDALKYYLKLYI